MGNLPFSSVSTTTHSSRITSSSTTHSSHISVCTDEIEVPEDSFSDFNVHCDDEEAVAEEIEANLEEETNSDLESESGEEISEDTYSLAVNQEFGSWKEVDDILLYSSVDPEGIQTIKVFRDDLNSSNVGCEVTHIDGSPALDVITDFAKNNIKNSRDLGVRFNLALVSLQLSNQNYSIIDGNFALRSTLPKNENVTYDIKCSNTNDTKKLIRPWKISANNDNYTNFYNFTDFKSYYESTCLIESSIQSTPFRKAKNLNLQTEQLADNKISITGENITYIGDFTMVLKISDIGVIVIPTFGPDIKKYSYSQIIMELVDKFDTLAKSGVKKAYGGYIELSQYLNNLFFSQKKASFPRDIKINNITTFLIKQVYELNFQLADFAPKSTLSYTTYEPFNNSDEYI
ncbi:12397_t:CDS:2, partial [Dentiscutata erythropus]